MASPAVKPKHNKTGKWIEENKKFFNPPVCNKMMHGESQMKCFYVGGPNIRKDYHIEEGPEFFYMVKGDMCLKIMERSQPKDIIIKQGQVFLLPPRIPHSPQRQADTVGLVIERSRAPHEMDCLRYFVEKDDKPTSQILYEQWFHCQNLGPQLAAIINEYFQTEQYKTGVPKPDTLMDDDQAPFKIDVESRVNSPFLLADWLDSNSEKIVKEQSVDLFTDSGDTSYIKVFGAGEVGMTVEQAETFIWVLRGSASVRSAETDYELETDDSLWIPCNTRFDMKMKDQNDRVLVLYMNPPPKQSS